MVDTQVERDSRINLPITIFDSIESIEPFRATETFENCGVVVVDNVPIDWDWVLKDHAKKRRKKLDEKVKMPSLTEDELEIYAKSVEKIRHVRDSCFPDYKFYQENNSSRLLNVGPEFMHFDTFPVKPGSQCLTGMLNVDDKPRVWNLTWNFPLLIQCQSKLMRKVYRRFKKKGENISVNLRARMEIHADPFQRGCPNYKVEFAPKSIFFFNPKLVAHRIVYGGGAVILASRTADASCLSQEGMLAEAFEEKKNIA